jgi:hypothetical protein
MYVEAHKLSDVVAGAALGTAVASAAVWGVTVLIALEGDRPGGWRAVVGDLMRRAAVVLRRLSMPSRP